MALLSRKVIVLAAHDDGVGAHTTMCRIRDGVASALARRKRSQDYLFLYLNSGAAGKKFLLDFWDHGHPVKWVYSSEFVATAELGARVAGVWQRTRNFLEFKKASDGSLDAPGTRKALQQITRAVKPWSYQLQNLNAADVSLVIEMGVPQAMKWAAENELTRIAVGDTLWSRTLMGSLKGAGEYDEQTEKFIHDLAQMERVTQEAWLIPILAPRAYADYLSELKVIYHWLPSFFGARPLAAHVQEMNKELHRRTGLSEPEKLIVLAAGQTAVWKNIYEGLATDFKANRGKAGIALAFPDGDKFAVIRDGKRHAIKNPSGDEIVALFANAALGVTRGGVTVPEFIAAGVPFAVIQEPNHWLSQSQQAAASEEGLCYTAGLSIFRNPAEAGDLLIEWVHNAVANNVMRKRYTMYDFGGERRFGELVVDRFLV